MTPMHNTTLDLSGWAPGPELLKDRIILITGAGDGYGRACALACAAAGATVILLGRTTRKLEAVYDAIEAAGGPTPAIFPLNLDGAAEKDYAEFAQAVHHEFGRLDGVVHNAAILGTLSPIDHYPGELWEQVLRVDLTAPFLLTRACLPLLRAAPDAAVLFISDRVGRQARAYWGAYAVAKHGLEGLAMTLAEELEQNTRIRVNTLDPGPLRTRLRNLAYPGEAAAGNPDPTERTAAVLHLLSPLSRHRGQQLALG